jgi:hypothetical protein
VHLTVFNGKVSSACRARGLELLQEDSVLLCADEAFLTTHLLHIPQRLCDLAPKVALTGQNADVANEASGSVIPKALVNPPVDLL